MFHISSIKNPEGTAKDIFHNPQLKIIPKIIKDKVEIYCELYLYADILIPNNSLLLDLKTNFGNFENIPLNTNYEHSSNYDLYFEAKFYFDLENNKELFSKLQDNKILEFYPSIRVDKDIFNAVNLTPSVNNVDYFIKKISFINQNQLAQDKYYYSNFYSLHNIAIKNIERNQINKPEIEVPIFNNSLNYNTWTNLYDFINFYLIDKQKSKIEWLELNLNYYLNNYPNIQKSFKFKITNNQETQIKKDSLYTNFDYTKNEVILSNKQSGYKGIFIPYKSSGNIKLNFKINSITYTQDFDFKMNQDLFGDDAKFNIKLTSYEQVN